MFIDEAIVILKAGHGGAGKVSFYPGETSGPDGGNGGRGGDVYIKATTDLTALRPYTVKKTLSGENGKLGESNRKFGRDGRDLTVLLPVGSMITDLETNQIWEVESADQHFLICKGGLGGRGNYEFKSSRNTTPMYAQPGLEGEIRKTQIILKLIADFGLIGLPNAGKSSLLNELTSSQAKVANYPFTTLEPNLGVINSKIIADIPGLIEGASTGKGLGIKFLKHIEKTSKLIHCISAQSEDVLSDYKTVWKELENYNPELKKKVEIIFITKSDLIEKVELDKKIKTLKKVNPNILAVSIYNYDQMEQVKKLF